MKTPTKSDINKLLSSGHFDAEWYCKTYPDVTVLGMDPAVHFLTYGHRLNRDPGPDFSTRFIKRAYALKSDREPVSRLDWLQRKRPEAAAPDTKRVLAAANEVAASGDHARAIALAEAYLSSDLAYTANILRANAALAQRDESAWQRHFNSYLETFGAAPIQLQGEGSIFDRLACAPLPTVTGGPLISVLMPAWNAEKTVRKAAQSILNQTWRNLELLIVDDCSEDDTWSVLQELAAADSRVKIMHNKANVGPYVSKNLALMQAQGEWITGQDADDWSHPQRLEKHHQYSTGNGDLIPASLVYMNRITNDGVFSHIRHISEMCLDGTAIHASISCMYHRTLIDSLGFWDSNRFGADSEMMARAALAIGKNVVSAPIIGMLCLDLDTSLSNHPDWGIDSSKGNLRSRKIYRDAWQEWHTKIAGSGKFYLEFPQKERKFFVNGDAAVPSSRINQVLGVESSNLKNMVFTLTDISAIGGISTRVSNTLLYSKERTANYIAICKKGASDTKLENVYSTESELDQIENLLRIATTQDTVVFVSNNTIKSLPRKIQERLQKFPIVYIAAGQLAFMIQDSPILKDYDYVKNMKASRIISFSDSDINFQRQLGVHGQVKGFVPINTRSQHSYKVRSPRTLAYVGRIDFHSKDCEKLIDIAAALKEKSMPPLNIFTTSAKNSPDFKKFNELIDARNLQKDVNIILNVREKSEIFSGLSWVIVPSKKESFGNVILEAYSFGIPVIAASYAPGPSELILDGKTGYLLDELTGNSVVDCINKPSDQELMQMSQEAFERHKLYSMERYYDFMERVAHEVLSEFDGENKYNVFPRLKMLDTPQV